MRTRKRQRHKKQGEENRRCRCRCTVSCCNDLRRYLSLGRISGRRCLLSLLLTTTLLGSFVASTSLFCDRVVVRVVSLMNHVSIDAVGVIECSRSRSRSYLCWYSHMSL